MTQQDLALAADVSYSTVRAIERGGRYPSDSVLDAIAAALGVDSTRLIDSHTYSHSNIRDQLSALSAVLAAYDIPDDGPVRPLNQLTVIVNEAAHWRLSAQYRRIAFQLPRLIGELTRALHAAEATKQTEVAGLLASAYRTADALAYKTGASDLSARLVDLTRWAAAQAHDPLLDASAAYVRTETFFAAETYSADLRALERALDAAPPPSSREAVAVRGFLHMRAAVIAARAGDAHKAALHLMEARQFGDQVAEGTYYETAFGPDSVRAHEVSVAVSLGEQHLQRALDIAHEWTPPRGLPAERRSGFYIELSRAQLWTGRHDAAYESLKLARIIAPQHARDHRWAHEDIAKLLRVKRSVHADLSNYARWCQAI